MERIWQPQDWYYVLLKKGFLYFPFFGKSFKFSPLPLHNAEAKHHEKVKGHKMINLILRKSAILMWLGLLKFASAWRECWGGDYWNFY